MSNSINTATKTTPFFHEYIDSFIPPRKTFTDLGPTCLIGVFKFGPFSDMITLFEVGTLYTNNEKTESESESLYRLNIEIEPKVGELRTLEYKTIYGNQKKVLEILKETKENSEINAKEHVAWHKGYREKLNKERTEQIDKLYSNS